MPANLQSLLACEGEILEDSLPTGPEQEQQLAALAAGVYQQFKDRTALAPAIVKEEIAASYESEPFLSESATLQAKTKFAVQVSLYMSTILRAALRRPAILYTTSTIERLNWYLVSHLLLGVKR